MLNIPPLSPELAGRHPDSYMELHQKQQKTSSKLGFDGVFLFVLHKINRYIKKDLFDLLKKECRYDIIKKIKNNKRKERYFAP